MSVAAARKEKRCFTLQEARKLVPLVRRMTVHAIEEVKSGLARLELLDEGDPEFDETHEAIDLAIRLWVEKLGKLGCEVKGLWIVDFDNGQGYYCWQYPELELDHYHAYDETAEERTRIC